MKTVVLVLILGFVASNIAKPNFDLKEDEEVALAMVECIRKVLTNGLPEANVPSHNPFVVTRNLTFEVDLGLVSGYIKFDNVQLHHIVNWTVTDVKGVHSYNPERLDYSYSLYWKDMPIVGDWTIGINTILGTKEIKGNISFNFIEMAFNGVWNMTLPGENIERHLDAFIVDVDSELVEVTLNAPWDMSLVNAIATPLVTYVVNIMDYSQISSFLQMRFNEFYLNNNTRIDAMINFCQQ